MAGGTEGSYRSSVDRVISGYKCIAINVFSFFLIKKDSDINA